MKVEVHVLGFPSRIVCVVSVDVKQHLKKTQVRAQELCESRGGRSGLPDPNKHYGFCGSRAAFEEDEGHMTVHQLTS